MAVTAALEALYEAIIDDGEKSDRKCGAILITARRETRAQATSVPLRVRWAVSEANTLQLSHKSMAWKELHP